MIVAKHGPEPSEIRLAAQTISVADACALTGLDLVAASEIESIEGPSYDTLERARESKAHAAAREAAVQFFADMGYFVYPSGVGVRGTLALADLLAHRNGRTVFVEVLSDSNVIPDRLTQKAQLQHFGELCFVFFVGMKRSDTPELVEAKRAVAAWADVLYCHMNPYYGIDIDSGRCEHATVCYETTRSAGIQVELNIQTARTHVEVAARFTTPRLPNAQLFPPSTCQEQTFLRLFHSLGHRIKWESRGRRWKEDVRWKRMRGRGLRFTDPASNGFILFRTECTASGVDPYERWSRLRDVPPDTCSGLFRLYRTGPAALQLMVTLLTEINFQIQYNEQGYREALQFLQRQ